MDPVEPPIPQDVVDFINAAMCPRCHTPHGHGFSVSAGHEEGATWMCFGKCLRCGYAAYARIVSSLAPLPTVGEGRAEITTDEVLDLHEALKSNDWLGQLTKAKS